MNTIQNNNFIRESDGDNLFKSNRPMSNYTKQNQPLSQQRSYENKRNQIQLQLIGEVNQQNSNIADYDRIEDISTSGSDPTFDTMTSVGDEQDTCSNRTRAQKVHTSSILAPAFKKETSMFMRPSIQRSAVYRQNDNKSMKSMNESHSAQKLSLPLNNNIESSASEESSAKSSRLASKKPALSINTQEPEAEYEKKSSSPKNESAKAAAIITERQVKYLGLVIEKDEEQLIEIGEESFMPNDSVKRAYIPIRDKYIHIVKNCRKLTIDSFDRRGRKDIKKSIKNLNKIARSFAKLNRPQIQFY